MIRHIVRHFSSAERANEMFEIRLMETCSHARLELDILADL